MILQQPIEWKTPYFASHFEDWLLFQVECPRCGCELPHKDAEHDCKYERGELYDQ